MKKLAIAIAIAAVVLVGLPPVFGYIAAAQVEDGLVELELLGLDAELLDYDRGWFASRARVALEARSALPAGLADAAEASLDGARPVVDIDIGHGPVAVLDGVSVGTSRFVARLDPAAAGVGAAAERLGIPYLFEFRGRTTFLGTLVYDADIPPIDATLGANARLAFSGLDLDGSYTRGQLVASAAAESLAVVTASGTLSFDALALDLDQDLVQRTGSGMLALDRGTLIDAFGTQPMFAIANLRLQSQSVVGAASELRDVSMDLAAESLEIPDWDVTAAELALDVRNVDIAAVEQFAALAEGGNAALLDRAPLIERLLAAGPELVLDPLRFRVDGEPLVATASVAMNPGAVPPTGALGALDMTPWLTAADAHATLEVAKPLATRIGALVVALQQPPFDDSASEEQRRFFAEAQAGLVIATLMAQGIIVESGAGYRIELGLRNGSLTVNGQRLL